MQRTGERGERRKFEQAGNGPTVKEAWASNDVLAERHNDHRTVISILDAELKELGVGRKGAHPTSFSGCSQFAKSRSSTLGLVAADDAQDEAGRQRELDLAGWVIPPEVVRAPTEQGNEHGDRESDQHA